MNEEQQKLNMKQLRNDLGKRIELGNDYFAVPQISQYKDEDLQKIFGTKLVVNIVKDNGITVSKVSSLKIPIELATKDFFGKIASASLDLIASKT